MAIYIDDEFTPIETSTVGAALEAAAQRLAESARVVVEVSLDGDPLTGDQIDQRRDEPLADRDLRLVSADPRALSIDTLEQVRARLGDARRLQDDAADLLQRDQSAAASPKIGEAIEAWLQTQQAVLHATTLTGVDLDAMDVDGEPVSAYTSRLLESLGELKAQIEAGDMVSLADALAYEWPEQVERWEKLVDALVGRLGG